MKSNIEFFTKQALEEQIRRTRLIAFDFDGVFTDNKVYVSEDGVEAVICYRGDGIGLQKLKKYGIETVIISSEKNPCVSKRSIKLGIRCLQGCEDKRSALEDIIQKSSISLNEVAFVGNDINDLPCLACVGLPIIVQDAHSDVFSFAKFQTKSCGGKGAVREICDLFERVISADQGLPSAGK